MRIKLIRHPWVTFARYRSRDFIFREDSSIESISFQVSYYGGALAAAFIFASAIMARAECNLNSPSGAIKHVVYVEFDNVHFTRDNPNVPSGVVIGTGIDVAHQIGQIKK
jgi:hypothetical protein